MARFASAELEQAWRRAAEANLGYYRAVGRLSGTYLRAVAGATRELTAARPSGSPAREAAPARAPAPVLALEAPAGSRASGVFVVENRSPERVSAPVEATALADPEGRAAETEPTFEPAIVTLAPGEQTLVQVTAPIGRKLRTGVDYRGTLRVPGLPATSIAIVVRRLPPRAASGRASRARRART